MLGDKELVDAVTSGEIRLEEIEHEALPEILQPMAANDQAAAIAVLAKERNELQGRIRQRAGLLSGAGIPDGAELPLI